MSKKSAMQTFEHCEEHGFRGFNKRQITRAVNDTSNRAAVRMLMGSVDRLSCDADNLRRELEALRDCLSMLEIKMSVDDD